MMTYQQKIKLLSDYLWGIIEQAEDDGGDISREDAHKAELIRDRLQEFEPVPDDLGQWLYDLLFSEAQSITKDLSSSLSDMESVEIACESIMLRTKLLLLLNHIVEGWDHSGQNRG